MKKPTPAQRRILERLADGYAMHPSAGLTWRLYKATTNERADSRIMDATVVAMGRAGWVTAGQITAAGRAALEGKP